MRVYFVDTSHRKAGPALHRHLVDRYPCCRISDQTHLIATDDSAGDVAVGLTATAGKPRLVEGLIGTSLDWTLLVAALAGTWAGTLGSTAAKKWVERYLSPPGRRPSRPTVFVAHWDATDIARRDQPDGFFRSGFRDWIYPSFNTYVLAPGRGPKTSSREFETSGGARVGVQTPARRCSLLNSAATTRHISRAVCPSGWRRG